MATYAVGDIQGCFSSLTKLLDTIEFDSKQDRLWCVGDLVNRGPQSLQVLRFLKNLGSSAITVLGNHDLHALAVSANITPQRTKDTLQELLAAPDREELIAWLRHQPLLHEEENRILVHAGLLPEWTVPEAKAYALEVEECLRSNHYQEFLAFLYSHKKDSMSWHHTLQGHARLTVITQALTKLRICSRKGLMNFTYKGSLDHIPNGFLPWFDIPHRNSIEAFIVFGHWSAMGTRIEKQFAALDSGCVWGRKLTAFRLEDKKLFDVSCETQG